VMDWSCVGLRPVDCFSSASPGAHVVGLLDAVACDGDCVLVLVVVGIVVCEVA